MLRPGCLSAFPGRKSFISLFHWNIVKSSFASIDCGNDNIEYACAELLSSLTFSEKHPYVQKCPECEYT